jgi:outer membrane protein assembly factor BamB
VVYVGSDNGTVYAMNEATGAVSWSATLAGAVTGSPSVDPAVGLVIVGDASGTVTALSTATGAVVWTHAAGGSIGGSVTIIGGRAYVGSTNQHVYALDEVTGQPVWTQTTGGSIVTNGAIYYTQFATAPSEYVVGASDGNLYYMSLSTGKVSKVVPIGGPIVGLSGAQGWIDASTSNGIVAGDKPGNVAWKFKATAGYASAATPLNGIVYVTGLDQTIRAFTIPGRSIP